MAVEYTNDRKLEDYVAGNATGVSYNSYSSLGANHRPSPPVSPPPQLSKPEGLRSHLAGNPQPQVEVPPYKPSFLDNWVWDLSDNLTCGFDSVWDRIKATSAWRNTIYCSGAVFGIFGLLISWSAHTDWTVTAVLAAISLTLGFVTPFLLAGLCRLSLWLVGALVKLFAVVAITALIIGVAMCALALVFFSFRALF